MLAQIGRQKNEQGQNWPSRRTLYAQLPGYGDVVPSVIVRPGDTLTVLRTRSTAQYGTAASWHNESVHFVAWSEGNLYVGHR